MIVFFLRMGVRMKYLEISCFSMFSLFEIQYVLKRAWTANNA